MIVYCPCKSLILAIITVDNEFAFNSGESEDEMLDLASSSNENEGTFIFITTD